ncbi:MAG: restriction endonuclease [Candidatus Altiarchaeota archaeon]
MALWMLYAFIVLLAVLVVALILVKIRNDRRLAEEKRTQDEQIRIRQAELDRQKILGEQKKKAKLELKRAEAKRKEEAEKEKIKKEEAGKEAQGLIRIFHHDRFIWVKPEEKDELEHLEKDMRYNFPDMNPNEFSGFIKRVFSSIGFLIAAAQGGPPTDFLAQKSKVNALVRVSKREREDVVSKDEVNRFIEDIKKHEVNQAYFVTTSIFSAEARDLEKTLDSAATLTDSLGELGHLELWDFQKLYEFVDRIYMGEKR